MAKREPLTADLILAAAAAVADRGGLAAVSMRNVATELNAQAMSLYHHVAGKEALLDGLADWAFARIALPRLDQDWREALTERSYSAREVFLAHPWALGLIESRRSPGPASLTQHDRVLGCLRRNGFSIILAAHTFSVIDAYVFGFVLTEVQLPFTPSEGADAFIEQLELPTEQYPYLAELIAELVVGKDYAYADEFDHGLQLILDQLQTRLAEDTVSS